MAVQILHVERKFFLFFFFLIFFFFFSHFFFLQFIFSHSLFFDKTFEKNIYLVLRSNKRKREKNEGRNGNEKNQETCTHYLKGSCNKGEECRFRHPEGMEGTKKRKMTESGGSEASEEMMKTSDTVVVKNVPRDLFRIGRLNGFFEM